VSLTDEQIETLGKAGLAQVAPVCAVLGGMLGNEIIKVISGKGEPANNTLLLDGNTCKAFSFLVKAKE
jgi:ubiquitin-like 1-activating enzyme E1 A